MQSAHHAGVTLTLLIVIHIETLSALRMIQQHLVAPLTY